jgi:hypothetical protein
MWIKWGFFFSAFCCYKKKHQNFSTLFSAFYLSWSVEKIIIIFLEEKFSFERFLNVLKVDVGGEKDEQPRNESLMSRMKKMNEEKKAQ